MDRKLMSLAVLAAAGVAASEAGRDALDVLISPAAAQQAGEAEERRGEAESEVARAAAPAMPISSVGVESSDEHGEHLVDGRGRALYLLEGESNGESMCYDRCAEQWPPVVASRGALPDVQDDADESLLGTFERRDGSVQLTYGDYPLYYYYRDEDGRVMGQDVHDAWGEWYLVTPDGEPLEEGEGEESGRGAAEESDRG